MSDDKAGDALERGRAQSRLNRFVGRDVERRARFIEAYGPMSGLRQR